MTHQTLFGVQHDWNNILALGRNREEQYICETLGVLHTTSQSSDYWAKCALSVAANSTIGGTVVEHLSLEFPPWTWRSLYPVHSPQAKCNELSRMLPTDVTMQLPSRHEKAKAIVVVLHLQSLNSPSHSQPELVFCKSAVLPQSILISNVRILGEEACIKC